VVDGILVLVLGEMRVRGQSGICSPHLSADRKYLATVSK